jgi:putative membrane protein
MAEVKEQLHDASRRTHLASERTQLAWWRTGLTALAVAIGVGRVVPELDPEAERWPYALIGIGFALYGISLIIYGTLRARGVDRVLAAGGTALPPDRMLGALTVAGAVLGVCTALVIVLD